MQTIDSHNEEQKYTVRKLEISDKAKGFIELLQQLSVCDSVSDKEFEDRFHELSSLGDDHVIFVIEDEVSRKIVATGSVFIEKKFLRKCGKVGHIEDVVVDSSTRGKQLGKKIINFLTESMLIQLGAIRSFLIATLRTRLSTRNVASSRKRFRWLNILFD